MNFEQLKEKALTLPVSPGVYLMKDVDDKVIYVGKAKKLKNRVSQYFQDTASHNVKTRLMVSKIDHFDVIVAASEFEALVLECSLIKRYKPKYNILLKDDKGYPYLRLDLREDYPRIQLVNKIANDGAHYFGPFGSRSTTNDILEVINKTLKLPRCNKRFPVDTAKNRTCLSYHLDQCSGWCQMEDAKEGYARMIQQAKQLLQGDYKGVADQIRTQMFAAADDLNFELAASLRNRLSAVEALHKKQLVTAGSLADTDVIGYAQTETKACFSVLHFSDGNLLDKDYEVFSVPEDREQAVSALIKQYYVGRGFAPKVVLLPFGIEDRSLIEQLLEQENHRRTKLQIPQRGDRAKLVELAVANALEEARRVTDQDERVDAVLRALGKMTGLPSLKRIESFDISNVAGTDIVASMVVFVDGKARRSEYKRFKIENLDGQDDYASMSQVIERRFKHYLNKDEGFQSTPDLLLIDGGVNHARTVEATLCTLGLTFPVFGMVKDDRHRTRGLVTSKGEQIRIDSNQAVFSLVGNIQEETHRFAINYHRTLRTKRLRYSVLDQIPGIGPKRKRDLLKAFKSISGIKAASLTELEHFLPQNAAAAVFRHFREKTEDEGE